MDPMMDFMVLLANLMIDLTVVQLLVDLTSFGHFDDFGAFGRSGDFVRFDCGSDGSEVIDEKMVILW